MNSSVMIVCVWQKDYNMQYYDNICLGKDYGEKIMKIIY